MQTHTCVHICTQVAKYLYTRGENEETDLARDYRTARINNQVSSFIHRDGSRPTNKNKTEARKWSSNVRSICEASSSVVASDLKEPRLQVLVT